MATAKSADGKKCLPRYGPLSDNIVLLISAESLLVAAKDLFLLYAIGQGDIDIALNRDLTCRNILTPPKKFLEKCPGRHREILSVSWSSCVFL